MSVLFHRSVVPKTFTRNTIGQERLANISILNIEKIYPVHFDTIINESKKAKYCN